MVGKDFRNNQIRMRIMQQVGTLLRCPHMEERRIAFYHEIGLDSIQIAGVFENWLAPGKDARKASDDIFALLRKYDISVPTMFLSFPNQDWAHPREGIGLVPEKTRAERMILSCRQMNWGKRYGIRYITCHVGFVPEERGEFYERFIADMKQLVRFAAANEQEFLFETGTENVAGLKRTIEDIGEPNVGINFDPANLLIYGTDDPAVLADQLAMTLHIFKFLRPDGFILSNRLRPLPDNQIQGVTAPKLSVIIPFGQAYPNEGSFLHEVNLANLSLMPTHRLGSV